MAIAHSTQLGYIFRNLLDGFHLQIKTILLGKQSLWMQIKQFISEKKNAFTCSAKNSSSTKSVSCVSLCSSAT